MYAIYGVLIVERNGRIVGMKKRSSKNNNNKRLPRIREKFKESGDLYYNENKIVKDKTRCFHQV